MNSINFFALDMSEISVNNVKHTIADDSLLSELLIGLGYDLNKKFAVAVNGEFISRGEYKQHTVNHGDEIDIVAPVGGG